MAEICRVFVGCSPNYEDAESQAVLEYSIRKHASIDVDITWMHLSRDPASPFFGWDSHRWATPFSGFRWAVPELCGFEGRAIYCDSDFIFLSDIRELLTQQDPLPPGKVALGLGGNNWRMCCSVFDCARAGEHIPLIDVMKQDSGIHPQLNSKFRSQGLVQPFIGDWNNLDGKDGKPLYEMDALHYTCMNTQPHLEYAIPRLERQGIRHWFDGEVAPHPREDVRGLFRHLLHDAGNHGFEISRYMQHEPFGAIDKRSFAGRTRV